MVIEPLEVMSQKVNQAELWLWTSDILSWLCAMDYFPGAYTGGKNKLPFRQIGDIMLAMAQALEQ